MRRAIFPISTLVCGLLIAALATQAARAAPPASDSDLSADVIRLLNDLNADSRKTRESAEQDLLTLGPRILPLLPSPDQISSAAARDAVRRIRVLLERQKAQASVEPSRVTLQGDMPLAELLKQITAQTGNALDAAALPTETMRRELTINVRRESFWPVMETIAGQARLRIDPGESGELRLRPRDSSNADAEPPQPASDLAATSAGPFRVALRAARWRPSFVENSPRLLRLQLSVMSEPRLRPLFLKFSPADFAVTTEHKERLVPTSPAARFELPFGDNVGRSVIQVDFDARGEAAATQASLAGKLTVLTAAGPERFEFRDLSTAQGVSRRRGGVTVRIDDVVRQTAPPNAGDVSLRISVAYDAGGPAFESHRSWMFQNEAWLQSPDGPRIGLNEPPMIRRQADGAVAVEYRFADAAADLENLRFVYVAPTLLIDVPVNFQFDAFPVSPLDQ